MHSATRYERSGQLSSRWASAADLECYYQRPIARTVRARVILLDGAPVAVVGLARWPGHYVFFSEYKPEIRDRLAALPVMRAVRCVVAMIPASALPVLSIADALEPDAPRVLERLGFVALPDHERIYQWPG